MINTYIYVYVYTYTYYVYISAVVCVGDMVPPRGYTFADVEIMGVIVNDASANFSLFANFLRKNYILYIKYIYFRYFFGEIFGAF